jgi:hypothetical protein
MTVSFFQRALILLYCQIKQCRNPSFTSEDASKNRSSLGSIALGFQHFPALVRNFHCERNRLACFNENE